jgi:alanine racemase
MPITEARAWIELDLDAMRANYDTIRRSAGSNAAVIPMVKANGYGLGLETVVRALDPMEPWGFGVATATEGAMARRAGSVRPVLVVTPMAADEVGVAARSRLTASISSTDGLDAWVGAAERVGGAPLDFHVEVDTGMGRSGFGWREVGDWAPSLVERLRPSVRWTGCFTHFHSADAPDEGPCRAQWERFRETLVQLPVPASELMVHASNSAAALRWPAFSADAVRPGIFLYGGHPAPEAPGVPSPRPVVAVKARMVLVRDKAPGSTAGYGATYTAAERERWGTVAIGYGDGVPRAIGNRGAVLVRGRRCAVIGRVSMDLITVSLRDVPEARAGDVVTVIGEDGAARVTVDEVATLAGTIGYEILTGLGTRLPRIVARGRDEVGENRCAG